MNRLCINWGYVLAIEARNVKTLKTLTVPINELCRLRGESIREPRGKKQLLRGYRFLRSTCRCFEQSKWAFPHSLKVWNLPRGLRNWRHRGERDLSGWPRRGGKKNGTDGVGAWSNDGYGESFVYILYTSPSFNNVFMDWIGPEWSTLRVVRFFSLSVRAFVRMSSKAGWVYKGGSICQYLWRDCRTTRMQTKY